ncbi:unnamed protein product [Ostreobium quekettii]|uniref:Protein kinase domain-containing protein n=1 Tax=Ostreobium quekettii TaxID=121088 RepID=A0A8S1JA32_9CHLO|nr:unnamed protein product [Ostreobium quekettii]
MRQVDTLAESQCKGPRRFVGRGGLGLRKGLAFVSALFAIVLGGTGTIIYWLISGRKNENQEEELPTPETQFTTTKNGADPKVLAGGQGSSFHTDSAYLSNNIGDAIVDALEVNSTVHKSPSQVQHREWPQASALMYNQGMMGFLEEQLTKARTIKKPADEPADELKKYDYAIEKGDRLLKKHQRFELKSFYRIHDARRAVEGICGELLGYLEDWGVQGSQARMDLKQDIPEELVDGDKHHMYMLLAYVLKGQTLSSELRRDWEVVKADHEMALRGLQVIGDEDLQIKEKIGEGGYGSMYKAEWQSVLVAIKDIVPPHHQLSLEDFASFFKEASIQASLTFHHITSLYAITKSGRMVMELASCDLASLSRRGQLSWPAKRRTLHQAALGLRHLHSRSPPLIHRDVKSSNFLVFGTDMDTWTVKVSDFGLTGECTRTVSKTVRGAGGTLEWMAPEVYHRKPLTLASDIFSFGVVMYEVVTGRHPYGVEGWDPARAGAVVMNDKLSGKEPVEVREGQCPPEMLDLMRMCIACDAGARPTIDEICKALASMTS